MTDAVLHNPVVTVPCTGRTGLAVKYDGKFAVPSVVNGFRVIAATKIIPRGYEVKDVWVVIVDRESDFDRYVVWFAYLVDRGEDIPNGLFADTGFYTGNRADALDEYFRRIGRRGLAES